jgi:hypothetical protein
MSEVEGVFGGVIAPHNLRTVSQGLMPIDEAGNSTKYVRLLGFDPETSEVRYKDLVAVGVFTTDTVIDLNIGGYLLTVSPKYEVHSATGWKKAKDLIVGDAVTRVYKGRVSTIPVLYVLERVLLHKVEAHVPDVVGDGTYLAANGMITKTLRGYISEYHDG